MRGSTPCQGNGIARYGGNTSCASVDVPGHDPILLDLGTGARYFGVAWPADRTFTGTCLLSHVHWDHVQGLPFFPPLLRRGSTLEVFAPSNDDGSSVSEIMAASLNPPLFPIGLDDFPGTVTFNSVDDSEFDIGEVRVTSRLIPHIGRTCGYRLEWGGSSLAYLSDHQQPGVDVYEAESGALELCRDVDVMVHDAQYTRPEFERKPTWGHCTAEYAQWLATEAGATTLVLFHYDPTHDDDRIDAQVTAARERACGTGLQIVGAREGLTITVGR